MVFYFVLKPYQIEIEIHFKFNLKVPEQTPYSFVDNYACLKTKHKEGY